MRCRVGHDENKLYYLDLSAVCIVLQSNRTYVERIAEVSKNSTAMKLKKVLGKHQSKLKGNKDELVRRLIMHMDGYVDITGTSFELSRSHCIILFA